MEAMERKNTLPFFGRLSVICCYIAALVKCSSYIRCIFLPSGDAILSAEASRAHPNAVAVNTDNLCCSRFNDCHKFQHARQIHIV